MMVYENQYKAKLTDSHTAVEQIGSNSVVAVGQAVCQPPALMEALIVGWSLTRPTAYHDPLFFAELSHNYASRARARETT
jgi:hypothetical protein